MTNSVTKPKKSKRCEFDTCRTKLGLANGVVCRCDKHFCHTHIVSTTHDCKFDYKTMHKKIIEQQNIKVKAIKIDKI